VTIAERAVEVLAREVPRGFQVQIEGVQFDIETERPSRSRSRKSDSSDFMEDGRWVLLSPLTGAVVDIRVQAGDLVKTGTVLMVVEAMKMQNDLLSRVSGKVAAVHAASGQHVEAGMRLIEIEAAAEPGEQ
jgi:glutaconyl-CoA/methylmalonyl-CoA decarboxylase subunit gamma